MDLLAGGAAADPVAAEVNISSDASPRLEAGAGEEDSSMDFAASIEKVKDVSKLHLRRYISGVVLFIFNFGFNFSKVKNVICMSIT